MGVRYNKGGFGVPQDFVQGVRWRRKAADQGFALAQFTLGGAYAICEGVPRSDSEVLKWCRAVDAPGRRAWLCCRSV